MCVTGVSTNLPSMTSSTDPRHPNGRRRRSRRSSQSRVSTAARGQHAQYGPGSPFGKEDSDATLKVGIPRYPGFDLLDVAAPYQTVTIAEMDCYLIRARHRRSGEVMGRRVDPTDDDFDACKKPDTKFDMLFVPDTSFRT
jgi:hypothetical protein